jgi:leucyl-tRNA---protein transferase
MRPGNETGQERQLALYLTAEHPCSYLEGLRARTLFVDPLARLDTLTYQALVDQGFRRSGSHVYRPACRGCTQCVPVRIPVADFRPDRSQRRNWQRNAPDMRLVHTPAVFQPGHFALYLRYLASRHPDGGMADDTSAESYRRFLVDAWGGETHFLELRLGDRLVAVAVTDRLAQGLSAVYTFFDPELADRGPGTFAVLAQIEVTRRLGLPYLYLGYWIGACRKMAYKDRFRPVEAWDGRAWRRFERGRPLSAA